MSKLAILSPLLLVSSLGAWQADQKPVKDEPAPETRVEGRRWPRVRLGGIMVGAGYNRWSGGGPWGPYWGPAYWASPYWGRWGGWGAPWGFWGGPFYSAAWDPFFWSPYYWSGFGSGPNMGEVKLRSELKDAEVFLDGAYAGTAGERKSMWLDPGAYNLEVRAPGKDPFVKRIYVLSGKTLTVNARMEVKP